jgi:hypothetical protein
MDNPTSPPGENRKTPESRFVQEKSTRLGVETQQNQDLLQVFFVSRSVVLVGLEDSAP